MTTVIPCWGTRALIPKVICEVHAQTLTPSILNFEQTFLSPRLYFYHFMSYSVYNEFYKILVIFVVRSWHVENQN
ncbi:hypothetical protein BpHYR1_029604 [Brachionus plicatilis]|uniref:Uncharacterized protein n=1 Tax=Brachionus plicatilis TaxID=10195 RepID=A0A3M7RPR9_BRAPC|nr:hypothetical protein BpHYR1_029604 [Brachionus plicatilis]